MTVLVTGATGNVGRYLAQHLLGLGAQVRCLTRNPSTADLPDGVEVVQGDLADPTTLDTALAGVREAHFISFAGNDYAPITHADEILAKLARAGATRVTVLKGDLEESPLEKAARASGLEWTFLAPVEFMANMRDWSDSVRAGRLEEAFVDVPSTVVHESDIAAVAAHVLVRGGHHRETLWITGPAALTVRDRLQIIQDVTGQSVDLVAQSTEQKQDEWRSYGLSEDDIAYITLMKTDPPEQSRVPTDTVEQVTGHSALTFRDWVTDNLRAFTGPSE